MNEKEVRERAFAMPLTSPAYPRGPYRFYNREYFIITYRTDPDALMSVVKWVEHACPSGPKWPAEHHHDHVQKRRRGAKTSVIKH